MLTVCSSTAADALCMLPYIAKLTLDPFDFPFNPPSYHKYTDLFMSRSSCQGILQGHQIDIIEPQKKDPGWSILGLNCLCCWSATPWTNAHQIQQNAWKLREQCAVWIKGGSWHKHRWGWSRLSPLRVNVKHGKTSSSKETDTMLNANAFTSSCKPFWFCLVKWEVCTGLGIMSLHNLATSTFHARQMCCVQWESKFLISDIHKNNNCCSIVNDWSHSFWQHIVFKVKCIFYLSAISYLTFSVTCIHLMVNENSSIILVCCEANCKLHLLAQTPFVCAAELFNKSVQDMLLQWIATQVNILCQVNRLLYLPNSSLVFKMEKTHLSDYQFKLPGV